jgi:hypothetical protein
MPTKNREISFLNDEPYEGSSSSTTSEMERIAETIYTTTVSAVDSSKGSQPMTVAIYGPWGSGKTSILRCIKRCANKSEPSPVCLQFEPWRYEQEEKLIVPLLTELTVLVSSQTKKEELKSAIAKTGFKLLGQVAKAGARTAAGFAANQIGMKRESLEQIGRDFVSFYSQESDTYSYPQSENLAFREDFQDLIYMAANEEKRDRSQADADFNRQVIILIDDLDRCAPEQVKRLLESMKNFLWSNGVIFILALDKEQVTQALAKEDLDNILDENEEAILDVKTRAKHYMEKFFLTFFDLTSGSANYEDTVIEKAREQFWSELIKYHEDVTGQKKAFREIYRACGPNLRRIKRALRWLHYELNLTPLKEASEDQVHDLQRRFAEMIFSENYPEVWLDLFAEKSKAVRLNLFTHSTVILDFITNQKRKPSAYEISENLQELVRTHLERTQVDSIEPGSKISDETSPVNNLSDRMEEALESYRVLNSESEPEKKNRLYQLISDNAQFQDADEIVRFRTLCRAITSQTLKDPPDNTR